MASTWEMTRTSPDEGHFWVLAQQLMDPPVIIAATAPITELWQWPRERTAADLLEELITEGRATRSHRYIFW
jgi:hypothetical protein